MEEPVCWSHQDPCKPQAEDDRRAQIVGRMRMRSAEACRVEQRHLNQKGEFDLQKDSHSSSHSCWIPPPLWLLSPQFLFALVSNHIHSEVGFRLSLLCFFYPEVSFHVLEVKLTAML